MIVPNWSGWQASTATVLVVLVVARPKLAKSLHAHCMPTACPLPDTVKPFCRNFFSISSFSTFALQHFAALRSSTSSQWWSCSIYRWLKGTQCIELALEDNKKKRDRIMTTLAKAGSSHFALWTCLMHSLYGFILCIRRMSSPICIPPELSKYTSKQLKIVWNRWSSSRWFTYGLAH